jgi:hypothetical protein
MNCLIRILSAPALLLLACALTFAADEKKDDKKDDKKPAAEYYPLAVGNAWQYKVGITGFTLKVARKEKVKTDKGEVEAARIELISNNKPVSFEHIGVAGDAVVRYTFEGKPATPPIPFLKLPAKKGTSWPVDSKIDGQVLKGTFVEGEEEVKVPAGTFKTVTVTGKDLDVNGRKMTLTYYFADKVGMVKQVIELEGQKVIIELEKFEPAKS